MRTAGFVSFICAFVSLMHSSLYIIHFAAQAASHEHTSGHTVGIVPPTDTEAGSVADTSRQPNEAEDTCSFHDIWVLISQPAVWTGWSIITFILFILIFLWTTYSTPGVGLYTLWPDVHLWRRDHVKVTATAMAVLPRFLATGVLLIGIVYLVLAMRAFRFNMTAI